MRGSIRKRTSFSYTITISAGTDPLTGKRKQFFYTVRGSKKEAEAFMSAKLNELDRCNGDLIQTSKLTLAELLENWLSNYIEVNDKTTTYENYESIIRNHLSEIGKLRLDQLQPQHFQDLYAKKLRHGGRADGRSGGLTKRTVHLIYSILREALGYAVKLRLMPTNPILSTLPPSQEKRKPKIWNETQVGKFLDAAKGRRFFGLFVTGIHTGLRKGELLALTWDDLDLENKMLHVSKTLAKTKKGLQVQPCKTTHSDRYVTLTESAVKALTLHREEQLLEKEMAGLKYEDRGLVFCSKTGYYFSPDNLLKRFFYPNIIRAEIPRITFHGLRHTHVAILLEHGENIQAVSERVGHSSVGFTVSTYGRPFEESQRRIAATLENVIPSRP